MGAPDYAQVLAALDQSIARYIQDRRTQVDAFVSNHFSLKQTLQIQKTSFALDLLCNPINALWSIPYLSLKKVGESLDKIGWSHLNPILEKIPSGIKTRYQKEVEHLLEKEFLSTEGLMREFQREPALRLLMAAQELEQLEGLIRVEFRKEIEKYTSAQAVISDLAGSLMTLLAGRWLFGNGHLGVMDMGRKIASKMAHDKAASHFFLGKRLGSAFYQAFPVQPTRLQVFLATLAVGGLLTACSLLTSVVSDPLRKKMGIHRYKLNSLLDSLEERAFLIAKREVKKVC